MVFAPTLLPASLRHSGRRSNASESGGRMDGKRLKRYQSLKGRGYGQGLLDLFPLIIVSAGGGKREIHHTERSCFSVCNRIR
jgi:hypothetical protein